MSINECEQVREWLAEVFADDYSFASLEEDSYKWWLNSVPGETKLCQVNLSDKMMCFFFAPGQGYPSDIRMHSGPNTNSVIPIDDNHPETHPEYHEQYDEIRKDEAGKRWNVSSEICRFMENLFIVFDPERSIRDRLDAGYSMEQSLKWKYAADIAVAFDRLYPDSFPINTKYHLTFFSTCHGETLIPWIREQIKRRGD